METLRCRTPAMVEKETLIHLITHNLIRWAMAQAATTHGADLERISFKGSLDGLRQFTHAMAQARSRKRRQALWEELLRTLVADALPERPGRRELRRIKRQHHKYDRLTGPRHRMRDRPKRHDRHKLARQRKLDAAK